VRTPQHSVAMRNAELEHGVANGIEHLRKATVFMRRHSHGCSHKSHATATSHRPVHTHHSKWRTAAADDYELLARRGCTSRAQHKHNTSTTDVESHVSTSAMVVQCKAVRAARTPADGVDRSLARHRDLLRNLSVGREQVHVRVAVVVRLRLPHGERTHTSARRRHDSTLRQRRRSPTRSWQRTRGRSRWGPSGTQSETAAHVQTPEHHREHECKVVRMVCAPLTVDALKKVFLTTGAAKSGNVNREMDAG
jgi:hypothetical protein